MQTQSKNNILKSKKFFALNTTKHPIRIGPEPTSIIQTLKGETVSEEL